MSNITYTYSYQSAPVSFSRGDEVMINATQMARAFKKRPNDYLSLPSTIELLKAITRKSGNSEYQAVTTKPGSPENGGGTWMTETVALDFAQWLSVDFRLWCNDRIKELMRDGVTTTATDDQTIAKAMAILQSRLEEAKRETALILDEIPEYAIKQYLRKKSREKKSPTGQNKGNAEEETTAQ